MRLQTVLSCGVIREHVHRLARRTPRNGFTTRYSYMSARHMLITVASVVCGQTLAQ
jgi:hypothetical protein